MVNPNLITGTCDIAPYPISCDQELWWDWNECILEEGVLDTYFDTRNVIVYATNPELCLVFISMAMILVTSCVSKKSNDNENQEELMYIGVSIFSWLWFSIHYIHANVLAVKVLNAIFFPLQGFWNLLIFLYDKAFHLRQRDPELGFL